MLGGMADVTHILSAIEAGDPQAAAELLPLVYDELRKLAAARLADEKPGQTLQATALVHEAYLRLVGGDQPQHWNGRGHFFAAAAEAMRRILVDSARRKQTAQGTAAAARRLDLDDVEPAAERAGPTTCSPWTRPSTGSPREDPRKAELVKLRLLRRPDRRGGGRRPRRLHRAPPTGTGRTPAPGSGWRSTAPADRP